MNIKNTIKRIEDTARLKVKKISKKFNNYGFKGKISNISKQMNAGYN